MDEHILKKMEEEIERQLSNFIKPPNVDNIQVKVKRSIVEAEKVSDNSIRNTIPQLNSFKELAD